MSTDSTTREYQPRDGDEVEVVLRGTVTGVGFDGFRIGDETVLIDEHVVSVTRVRPPLPTEPWSLRLGTNDHPWLLLPNGLWQSCWEYGTVTPADLLARYPQGLRDPSVVFPAVRAAGSSAQPTGDLTDGRVVSGASPSRDDDLDARITADHPSRRGRTVVSAEQPDAVEAAWDELERLAASSEAAIPPWRWSILPDPKRDSGLILAAGLAAQADALDALREERDAAVIERDRLARALEDAEYALALKPIREVIPAIAVHLDDEVDWEPVAAWCGGQIVNHEVADTGEYQSTLRLPNGQEACDGSWVVQHQDGTWSVVHDLDATTIGQPPERDRAVAAVERVRALHKPARTSPVCSQFCNDPLGVHEYAAWPCPTVRALDGVLDDGSPTCRDGESPC